MIRDLNVGDLVALEKHAQFPIDFLVLKPKILEKAIEDDKGLIGAAFVTSTTEISIILDESRSNLTKAKAIKTLHKTLYRELCDRGYQDAFVFIQNNPRYADLLIDHCGFEDVVGRALVIRRR